MKTKASHKDDAAGKEHAAENDSELMKIIAHLERHANLKHTISEREATKTVCGTEAEEKKT